MLHVPTYMYTYTSIFISDNIYSNDESRNPKCPSEHSTPAFILSIIKQKFYSYI